MEGVMEGPGEVGRLMNLWREGIGEYAVRGREMEDEKAGRW